MFRMSSLRWLPGRAEAWLGGRLLRLVLKLPDGVLRRLAGAPPHVAEGLHPEAWLIGRLAAAGPDRMSDDAPVAEQRRRLALQSAGVSVGPAPGAVGVTDLIADGVPVRLYVPPGAASVRSSRRSGWSRAPAHTRVRCGFDSRRRVDPAGSRFQLFQAISAPQNSSGGFAERGLDTSALERARSRAAETASTSSSNRSA